MAHLLQDGAIFELMESFSLHNQQSGFDAQQKKQNPSVRFVNYTPEDIQEICPQPVIKKGEDYELKKEAPGEDGYCIGNKLQYDSIFVIKTNAITDFLKSSSNGRQSKIDKDLSTKERETMLVILAALCNEAKVDLSKKAMAPVINKMAQNIGVSITDDTIRDVINQIKGATEARSN